MIDEAAVKMPLVLVGLLVPVWIVVSVGGTGGFWLYGVYSDV